MSRTAALTPVVAAAIALLAPAPAGAAAIGDDRAGLVLTDGNPGVSALHFQGVEDACWVEPFSGQPDACTPGAGYGEANVLRVSQSGQPDGSLAFDSLEGTSSIDGDWLWLGAETEVACHEGYVVDELLIDPARRSFDGPWSEPPLVPWRVHSDPEEEQTMPLNLWVINLPVDIALSGEGTSMVEDFDTPEDVFAYGEWQVAVRMAAGMSEEQARSLPFEVDTTVGLSAVATCKSTSPDGARWTKSVLRHLPLTVEFLPAPASLSDELVTPTDDDDPYRPGDVTDYMPSSGDRSGARWSTSWSAMPV